MDVRHLQLLRELSERGSVTAVAEATHRTVSAVSQQLRTAERSAGIRLVEPDGRGIRLTEAGRLLATGAVEVETAIARVQASLDAYRNAPGAQVSIAAFPSAAALLFPAVVHAAEREGIELRLADFDLAEAQFADLTADYDIVIGHSLTDTRPAGTPNLVAVKLAAEPLDVAMRSSHPLASHRSLRARDLADARWIGVPEGYPFDVVLTNIANRLGRDVHVAQRLRDNRVIETLLANSDLVAILPRFTTRRREGLVLRELTDVPATRYVSAIMRPDRAERRAVGEVLNTLCEAASAEVAIAGSQ